MMLSASDDVANRFMSSMKHNDEISTGNFEESESMRYGEGLMLFNIVSKGSIYMTHNSGEITSPWSIPICTLYGEVFPKAVMIELNRLVNRSRVRSTNRVGILRCNIASLSMLVSIESKALEMSCWKINSGLLKDLASCKMASKAQIGGSQEPPGRPAKLPN